MKAPASTTLKTTGSHVSVTHGQVQHHLGFSGCQENKPCKNVPPQEQPPIIRAPRPCRSTRIAGPRWARSPCKATAVSVATPTVMCRAASTRSRSTRSTPQSPTSPPSAAASGRPPTAAPPATTGRPTTDDPLISTISVDDIVIDPNNHNTVYAGTGDLNFGSFSMGSAGMLKSTDAGATWADQGRQRLHSRSILSLRGSSRSTRPSARSAWTRATATTSSRAPRPASSSPMTAATTGPALACPTAFTTQRQDVTGLILRDNGSVTDLYVAVGTRGYSTTVQYNLAENGANGIYKTTSARQRLPRQLDACQPPRPTAGRQAPAAASPSTRPAATRWAALTWPSPPATRNYIYAEVQAINPSGNRGRRTRRLAHHRRRHHLAAALRRDPRLTRAARRAGATRTGMTRAWRSTRTTPTSSSWTPSTSGSPPTAARTFTDLTCGYNGGNTRPRRPARAGLRARLVQRAAGGQRRRRLCHRSTPTPPRPTFTQLNDTLNTIEFYSGDITANFATSSRPASTPARRTTAPSVYVWPSDTCRPRSVAAAQGRRRHVRPHRAGARPALVPGEPERQPARVARPAPMAARCNATGGWTGRHAVSFVFPYEIYKYDCPPTGCTHLIAGSNRVWETITGGIPRSPAGTPTAPNLTKSTLADRSFINQLSYAVSHVHHGHRRHQRRQRAVRLRPGPGHANSATWVNVTGGNTVLPNRPILDVATDPVNPLVGYAAVGGFDREHAQHARPRLPGDLHRQLRLVHLGEQDAATCPTSRSTRSSPTRASRSRSSRAPTGASTTPTTSRPASPVWYASTPACPT